MSLSSSTDSGCDGPCEVPIEDTKDKNSSTGKSFVDNHSDSAYIPLELHTNVSNGELPNLSMENQNTKNLSSNELGITTEKEKNNTDDVSTDDKCKKVMPDFWLDFYAGRSWLNGRWSRKVPLPNCGADQSGSNATHQTSHSEVKVASL